MANRELTPPGIQLAGAVPSEAPVTDGGFSINKLLEPGDSFEEVRVFNEYYETYETRFITPTDRFGLPYCVVPNTSLPPARAKLLGPYETREADLNHQFPKHEVLTEGIKFLDESACRALINCRGQWLDYAQHHDVYHPQFVVSRLPRTKLQVIGILLLTNSGYVPENGLDFSGLEPKIVSLSKRERKWLWTSGQVQVICDGEVTNYLRDFVLDTETDHIDQKKTEEFLYTYDYSRRIKLGLEIASQLVERAVGPIEPHYQEVRKADVLTFTRVGAYKKASPSRAAELTEAKLMNGKRAGPMLSALHERLAQGNRRPFKEYFSERMAA